MSIKWDRRSQKWTTTPHGVNHDTPIVGKPEEMALAIRDALNHIRDYRNIARNIHSDEEMAIEGRTAIELIEEALENYTEE